MSKNYLCEFTLEYLTISNKLKYENDYYIHFILYCIAVL